MAITLSEMGELTLESSLSLLLLVICYKILRMKIHTETSCCGDKIHITTDNPGLKGKLRLIRDGNGNDSDSDSDEKV